MFRMSTIGWHTCVQSGGYVRFSVCVLFTGAWRKLFIEHYNVFRVYECDIWIWLMYILGSLWRNNERQDTQRPWCLHALPSRPDHRVPLKLTATKNVERSFSKTPEHVYAGMTVNVAMPNVRHEDLNGGIAVGARQRPWLHSVSSSRSTSPAFDKEINTGPRHMQFIPSYLESFIHLQTIGTRRRQTLHHPRIRLQSFPKSNSLPTGNVTPLKPLFLLFITTLFV